MFEICGFAVPDRCRVKRSGAINRFKPEGRPRQFLLQLVSDLTSILTVFLINLIKNTDYGKSRTFLLRSKNFFFFAVCIDVRDTIRIIAVTCIDADGASIVVSQNGAITIFIIDVTCIVDSLFP